MKVALVLPYASFVEANMCKAFEKFGIDPWIITSNRQRFGYRGTGIKFEKYRKTIRLPILVDNPLFMNYAPFPIMPKLLEVVKALNVDIVNVSEHVSPATWLLSLFKEGWKIVLTEHGGVWKTKKDEVYNFLSRKILIPRIEGFVGIGLKSKHFLESLGAKNVSVIPNPIDCTLFKPNLPYMERENIVLYVGRVDTQRGLHFLLKAMKIVKEKMKDARLLIIGAVGNLTDYVRKERGYIRYLGVKPHREMPKYYNSAKVYVNPYPTERGAGCGCALSEALACETPVVATKYSDFPFIWRDDEVGYLVNGGDSLGLANAIVKVLLNGNKMRGNCRKIALEEFSHESVGIRYLRVFKQVLGQN